jgi:hypothetical protein
MLKRIVLLAGIVLLLAGCPDSGQPTTQETESPHPSVSAETPSPSPTRKPKGHDDEKKKGDEPAGPDVDPPRGFEVVSTKAWTRCNAGPPLKGACPTVVPKTKRNYLVESFGRPGGRFSVLEMSSGAPRDDPRANAPPAFAHVVLEAGGPRYLIDFGGVAATAELSDSLLEQSRAGAISLGKRNWGGRKGRLLLAEPFPGGGAHGDHLVFEWKRGGVIHRISMHAWVPAAKAEKTFETVVASME